MSIEVFDNCYRIVIMNSNPARYPKEIARRFLEKGAKLLPFGEREEGILRRLGCRAAPVKRAEPRVS